MTLGQTITHLRRQKKLSQGELADRLDVSRQSVSKWETDASIPELDKLIKLSDLFGVTLDTLIRGEGSAIPTDDPAPPTVTEPTPVCAADASPAQRKTSGLILLCMGFVAFLLFTILGGLFAGLLFSSPLWVCGAICFIFRRRVGLWCAWALYILFDIYLAYATGISRGLVIYAFTWTQDMNFVRLGVAFALVAILAILLGCTLFSYRRAVLPPSKGIVYLTASGGAFLALRALEYLLIRLMFEPLFASIKNSVYASYHLLYQSVNLLLGWLSTAAFMIFTVLLFAWLRGRKALKNKV